MGIVHKEGYTLCFDGVTAPPTNSPTESCPYTYGFDGVWSCGAGTRPCKKKECNDESVCTEGCWNGDKCRECICKTDYIDDGVDEFGRRTCAPPPTKSPTLAPTTKSPTKSPTNSPTTKSPTNSPTNSPTTKSPTKSPTNSPTTKSP